MTINRTTLLDLPLPVTGTESGTWGDAVNNGLTQYVDIAVAGMTSLTSSDFAAGALSLSLTEGNASATNIAASSAQYGAIKVSSLAQASTITAPSSNRRYVIINADSTYNVTIKASGQSGVAIVPGEKALVAFNGTDYVKVGGAAGGSTTQVQFNNAGVFGGITNATTDGTTLSMTSPKVVTSINDTNGNELFKLTATGSAVNEVTVANAATGNNPVLSATGNDTNIGINLTPKGSGAIKLSGLSYPTADGSANQAIVTNGSGTLSFASVTTSPGGSTTQVQYNNAGAFGGITNATTDGTTLSMTSPKVITGINDTNGNELLKVTATASAVNELTLANAATGGNPVLSATGGDTNIGVTITPKGTGNLVLTSGNLVVADGKGIDFSATSGTGTSELLNDYEEGTWVPVLSDGTNNATSVGSTFGRYTKIGRMVFCSCFLGTSSLGSVSGNVRMTGLPFTSGNATYNAFVAGWAEKLNITAGNSIGGWNQNGTTYYNLTKWSAADGTTSLTDTDWSADGAIMASFAYFT